MALISTQAAGSVKGFGFTRPYIAPPSPVENSQNAVVNLSMNYDYDGTHNNPDYNGSGTNTWGTFKDETGNNNPQPKHTEYEYKNTFHSHLSPYHPGGWSCEFNSQYSLGNYSGTHGNNPGSGACTWESWVFLHPHHTSQTHGAGSSNRNMVISGRDTNYNNGSEQNGSWTFGVAGNQQTTATGVYLIYRNGGTTYKKYWHQGNPVNAGLIIPRGKWHHIAIVRSQGTDGTNVYKCYLNGTQLTSTQYDTFPDNMDHTSSGSKVNFFGGYSTVKTGGTILDGKIKDYALTHSAKYTSNFTPPTRPMSQTLDSSVNLMFPYGPTYAVGSGQSNVIVTNTSQIGWLMYQINSSGNFQTQAYANRTSMVRSSPYDYIVNSAKSNILGSVYMNAQNLYKVGISQGPLTNNVGTDPGISLGAGDFTIEFWYYMNGTNGASSNQEKQVFIDFRSNNSGSISNRGPYMYYWKPHDNGGLKIEYPGISMSNHKVMSQQWVHVAIVRSGDLGYLYINGNQSGGSASLAGRNFSSDAGRPMWGTTSYQSTGSSSIREAFNGYMTDCRITVGTAVYTGNFKPPSGRLTLTGGDYLDITNVNVQIPTGHVKQLLSFTNNPFDDPVGKEQYMHPDFNSSASYPANDIVKDKEEAEAGDFNGVLQESYSHSSDVGTNQDYFGWDVATNSDGTTYIASAPNDDTSGGDTGSAYILERGTTATLQGASYDNITSVDLSGGISGINLTNPGGILFNADGSKLIINNYADNTLYEFNLSTNYDISSSSLSYNNVSQATTNNSTGISMSWNNDGTKLFVLNGHVHDVDEYSLSTAYDITTLSHTRNFSVSSQANTRGMGFSKDGKKMFIGDANSNRLYKYNLTTGFDLSTASYSNSHYAFSGAAPASVEFDDAGTRMFLQTYSHRLTQFTLSVPFDPTTGSVTQNYYIQVSSQENQSYDFVFNGDKTKFYIVGPGQDRIFQYSTGGVEVVYAEAAKLANPDSQTGSHFGTNVGMNDAATRVVVGKPGPTSNNAGTQGHAYVYDKSGGSWPTTPTATIQSDDFASGDFFGKSADISGDGNYIVVGAEREQGYPGSYSWNGSAYVFLLSGGSWTQQAKLLEEYTSGHNDNNGRYFGQQVAIDTDGDTIAIGAPAMADGDSSQRYNSTYGHAEVWVRSGTTWSPQAEIKPSADDRAAEDGFGGNLALSGDGNTLVVGQKYYQGNAGANRPGNAWVFTRSGTTWTLLQKLSGGTATGDWFGFDVDISKDANYIAVSAPKEHHKGTGSTDYTSGKVFTFRKVGNTYALQGSFGPSEPTNDDRFGYSLAIANNASRIITGARKEDKAGGSSSDYGAVYTHAPASIANWPTTEPSQVGGASTSGKSYLYFNGGYNDSKILSKLIYPYGYDNVNTGVKGAAVFEGTTFSSEMIDGYAFTVEAWIYPMQPASDNTNTEHHLWSFGSPTESTGTISLKLKRANSSGTTFQWVFEENRDTDNNMASSNNFNQWYHVALVALGGYDQHLTNGGRGAEFRFFVNGVRDTTISNINISSYNWLRNGSSFVVGGQHVFGSANQFDSPRSGISSYGNGYRNFTGIIRNFRVERTNKYWGSNFTPTDLTSI